MYAPSVIVARVEKLEAAYRLKLKRYTPEECDEWRDRLAPLDPRAPEPPRPPSAEEERFILNETLLCKVDYAYWAERHCTINLMGTTLGRMYPLLESQQFVLGKMAAQEEAIAEGSRADGILVNVLKSARQVGISTLAESQIAHRLTTQTNVQALLASTVPGERGSGYLFSMLLRVLDNLPWWLKPGEVSRREAGEQYLELEGGSRVFVGAGKSMQGSAGDRGQLGRGTTVSACHLSELSTWENPFQIDESLLPAIPRSTWSLGVFESTARGRGRNWWHQHWLASRSGKGRFENVFIPWYVEKRYASPVPGGWAPSEDTLGVAKRIEETSPRWLGAAYTPTREQLYWYESTRAYHEEKDDLRTFLENYGAIDDDECFQMSGRGIFTPLELQRMQARMGSIGGVYEVTRLAGGAA